MTTATAPKHAPGSIVYGRRVHTVGPIRGFTEDFKPWEAPKLSEKGRAFEPKPGRPGSTIVFEVHEPSQVDGSFAGRFVRMTGEVWSDGPQRGDLWVVKDQVAYLVQGN